MQINPNQVDNSYLPDKIRDSIVDASLLDTTYITMNCLAAVIASYGLLINSPAVVIGAMIVAMLLGPITGLGLGLTDGNTALMKKGGFTLFCGVFGVYITAFIIGYIHINAGLTNEIMSRTVPNLFDLIVALAGGAAGALAMISPRLSVALVGVAIATALVPPLCSSAILLAHGQYKLSFGAFLFTFTNIIAIQFANSLVLWLSGYRKHNESGSTVIGFLKSQWVTLTVILVLGVFLTYNLENAIRTKLYESKVKSSISINLKGIKGAHLDNLRIDNLMNEKTDTIRATIISPVKITAAQVAEMEKNLPLDPDHKQAQLRVRMVLIDVITKDGKQDFE